jgi:hypothetical protein
LRDREVELVRRQRVVKPVGKRRERGRDAVVSTCMQGMEDGDSRAVIEAIRGNQR